ncbi:glycosyltransferase [Gracilibacillus sp. Marseille-QA3620]
MKKKISIVYMINSLKKGGPVNMLYNLIKYLDKGNFDVSIIALRTTPEKVKKDFSNIDCNVIELQGGSIFTIVKEVEGILKGINPDIVHSHGGMADFVNTRVRGNYKKFSTVHCDPDEDFVMKKGRLIGTLKASAFVNTLKKIEYPVACSQTVSQKLLNKRKFKIEFIKNGIDLEGVGATSNCISRKDLGIGKDKVVLVFCGYLSKRKNVSFLFDAFEKLDRDDIGLMILGDGQEYDSLKERAKKDNRILMIGRVDNAFDYLKCGDYIISASLSEGLPLAVMEGMACGLPAILSDIESHCELLTMCSEGIKTFNLTTTEGLVALLENIDKDCIHKEQLAALNTMKTDLNASRMAYDYTSLYNSALE